MLATQQLRGVHPYWYPIYFLPEKTFPHEICRCRRGLTHGVHECDAHSFKIYCRYIVHAVDTRSASDLAVDTRSASDLAVDTRSASDLAISSVDG